MHCTLICARGDAQEKHHAASAHAPHSESALGGPVLSYNASVCNAPKSELHSKSALGAFVLSYNASAYNALKSKPNSESAPGGPVLSYKANVYAQCTKF